MIAFVQGWWIGNVDLSCLNKTCVLLIPNCATPHTTKDFRPISICNVLYKVL